MLYAQRRLDVIYETFHTGNVCKHLKSTSSMHSCIFGESAVAFHHSTSPFFQLSCLNNSISLCASHDTTLLHWCSQYLTLNDSNQMQWLACIHGATFHFALGRFANRNYRDDRTSERIELMCEQLHAAQFSVSFNAHAAMKCFAWATYESVTTTKWSAFSLYDLRILT